MSTPIERFQDIVAWQKARLLVKEIYQLVESPPFNNKFAFRDQLERAAVSVMSNIAEGYERGSDAEFHHMLSIAKGSCAEVRSLLVVALDVGFMSPSRFESLDAQAEEVSKVIGGLRASVARRRDAKRNNRPD